MNIQKTKEKKLQFGYDNDRCDKMFGKKNSNEQYLLLGSRRQQSVKAISYISLAQFSFENCDFNDTISVPWRIWMWRRG